MLIALLEKMGLTGPLAKLAEFVLIAGLIGGSYWYASHHGAEIQKYRDDLIIAAANQKEASENQQLKDAVQSLHDAQVVLQAKLDAKAEEVVKEKAARLAAIPKEIKQNVTKDVDTRAVSDNIFTSGWVYSYNLSTAPQSPTGSVGASEPQDVGKATGLTASAVLNVIESNNAECAARAEVIEYWQDYYTRNQARWAEFLKSLPSTK